MSMRKPGTTPRPNRTLVSLLIPVLFIAIVGLILVSYAQAQATGAQTGSQTSPQASSSSSPAQATQDSEQLPPEALGPSTNPPPPLPVFTPSSTAAPGQKAGGNDNSGPASTENGIYIYRAEAREVFLHATVSDERNRLVTTLGKTDFTVFENDQPQAITLFKREDFPVAMGIVIDNSGSMREKRDEVNKAAVNLVRSSNKDDQVFVVNFSDEPILDQDFTADIKKLQAALEHVEARGGTALYDAVVAASDYLAKSPLQRKVLFIVTDGEDDASQQSLEEAVQRVQQENGPVIYAIGLLGGEKTRRARRALETFSLRTGGIAYFPPTLNDVDEISSSVARDIRNQYTISYTPTTPKSVGGYRTIRLEAHARGYKRLTARTRSGYYPGQEKSTK